MGMGATSAQPCSRRPDLELVAAVDPAAAGRPLDEVAGWAHGRARDRGGGIDAVAEAGAEVGRRLHRRRRRRVENLRWCAEHGVHAVCGTTGLDEADLEAPARLVLRGAPTPSSPRTSPSAPR